MHFFTRFFTLLPNFESLALRHIQKADKPLICKDLSVFLCLFSGRYDFLRVFAESCASFRGLLRAVFHIQINGKSEKRFENEETIDQKSIRGNDAQRAV